MAGTYRGDDGRYYDAYGNPLGQAGETISRQINSMGMGRMMENGATPEDVFQHYSKFDPKYAGQWYEKEVIKRQRMETKLAIDEIFARMGEKNPGITDWDQLTVYSRTMEQKANAETIVQKMEEQRRAREMIARAGTLQNVGMPVQMTPISDIRKRNLANQMADQTGSPLMRSMLPTTVAQPQEGYPELPEGIKAIAYHQAGLGSPPASRTVYKESKVVPVSFDEKGIPTSAVRRFYAPDSSILREEPASVSELPGMGKSKGILDKEDILLEPAALQIAINDFVTTGRLPGRGFRGMPMNAQVLEAVGQAVKNGTIQNPTVVRTLYAATNTAIKNDEKIYDNFQRNEKQAINMAKIVKDESAKFGRTGIKFANFASAWAKKQITDPQLKRMQVALLSFGREYMKIVTGSYGSIQEVSVKAQEKIDEMISVTDSWDALNEAVDIMKLEMEGSKKAFEDTIKEREDTLTSISGTYPSGFLPPENSGTNAKGNKKFTIKAVR